MDRPAGVRVLSAASAPVRRAVRAMPAPGGGAVAAGRSRRGWPWVLPALAVAALVAGSAMLRTADASLGFWIDEGLSVGIADRSLLDIPGVLRQDGSPPLYYMLLHGWMPLAGRSEEATHALSLVFALACIPVAGGFARSLFGARAGWLAAVLAAVNPFLTQYAQETRMYTLVVLLGLVATGAYLQVFAYGRRRWLPVFALALTAQLYTHNWALFFAAAAGLTWLGLVALARGADRARVLRDGVLGFGAVAILFAPWIPSLLFQAAHTGAPWARVPGPDLVLDVFGRLLGTTAQYVLLLAAGAGLVAVLRRRRPLDADGRAAAVLIALTVGSLVLAWTSSQVSPAWALRYLAVAVPPLLLLAVLGLARAGGLGLAGAAVVCVMWALDAPPPDKSNVRDVARSIAPSLRPGDLVVSTQPEQIPVLDYYLPDGLRYATLWGPVDDLGVTDWRDGVERIERTSAERDLRPLLDALPRGSRLVLVTPIVYERDRWSAPWTRLVRFRSAEWQQAVLNDPRFRVTATRPLSTLPVRANPVSAQVLVKLGS